MLCMPYSIIKMGHSSFFGYFSSIIPGECDSREPVDIIKWNKKTFMCNEVVSFRSLLNNFVEYHI